MKPFQLNRWQKDEDTEKSFLFSGEFSSGKRKQNELLIRTHSHISENTAIINIIANTVQLYMTQGCVQNIRQESSSHASYKMNRRRTRALICINSVLKTKYSKVN